MPDHQAWIDAGKPAVTEAAPVTETPVEPAVPVTAPDAVGAPAPGSVDGSTSTGPLRGPDGKFTAVAQAEAAGATPAQIEALEAWLDEKGEQKLSIPLTAMVPRKVNGVESRISIAQALKEHQLQADHTQKMQALAESRRASELADRKRELDIAADEAKRAIFQEEVDRFKAAQGDEEAMARLAADQDRLRNDPEYKRLYDDALEHRMGKASQARDAELSQFEESQSVADDGAAYITQVAAQYPGVDPADIQATISRMLRTGEMTIGPAGGQFNARTVDQLYQREAAKLKAAAAPALAELEGLRKRLDALEAEKKNGAVVAALRNGAPATGAPSNPRSPAPPADGRDHRPDDRLIDRAERWAKRR